MLEVGWSEILVVALILIIVVGPKELPGMLRTFGRFATKLRGMANEFKGQFDEALREAELDDVRKGISEVSKLNPSNSLRDAINPLRQLGQEIKSDLKKASDISLKPDAPMVAKAEDTVPEATTDLKPAEPVVAKVEAPVPTAAIAQPTVTEAVTMPTPKAPRKKAAAVAAPEPVVAEAVPVGKPAATKTAAVKKAPAKQKVEVAASVEPKKPAPRKKAAKAGDA
jgi:sec-independent protein translocase protein TatB